MMRALTIFAFALPLLAAGPALAQDAPQADDAQESQVIVVTGNPLSETAKRLKECLARHCPPVEDIEASLAHAENQFLAGDYVGSRRTLADSHDRNARFGKQYPVEVSDLDRAYGRLTNMNGFPEWGRILQIDALDTLKSGFDSKDSRILIQRLMTGDEYVQNGRIDAAIEVYTKVEKEARDAGQLRIAGNAMLRGASLYASLASQDYGYRVMAGDRLRRIERTTEPELADFRLAAQVMRARLAGVEGEKGTMESVIGQLAGHRFDVPVLVYEESPFRNQPATGVVSRPIDADPEWIDIRFRIDADGRVHDVEQLRSSPRLSGDWAARVLKVVPERRYVPLALKPGSNGLVRIERFSYVFDVQVQGTTGSHLTGTRATRGRLTWIDLTPDTPTAAR